MSSEYPLLSFLTLGHSLSGLLSLKLNLLKLLVDLKGINVEFVELGKLIFKGSLNDDLVVVLSNYAFLNDPEFKFF